MSSNRPIGFLDSGIGGITVLAKAVSLLPNEDFFFFSDSVNNPYGDKSDKEIIARCTEIVRYLTEEKNCKAVVIACNTASAKAVRSLRSTFPQIPFVAIEPAYKMVHDLSPDGATLIMATKGTILSEKFRRLYYAYYDHHTSIHSFVGLADLIEEGNRDKILAYLRITLANYKGVKNIVLGCTHYPLAKREIREVLGDVNFFDGAHGVSKQLRHILEEQDLLNTQEKQGTISFYDSSPTEALRKQKEERFYTLLSEDNI